MVEKFRPDFLKPEINVGPLNSERYASGTFTEVGNLENLPKSIEAQIPNGYVIKKYNRSDSPEALAISLILKEAISGKAVSLVEIAKELAQRHAMVKNYFEQTLPELVIPTQMVVGKDEITDTKTLYEIQPRLGEPNTTNIQVDRSLWPVYKYYIQQLPKEKQRAEAALENFITYLHTTFPQQIDLFKNQINTFVEQIVDFQSKENHFPFDCAMLTNLIFTEHGLKLIDTNAIMPMPLPRIDGVDPKDEEELIKFRTNMFEKSLEILKIIESKL